MRALRRAMLAALLVLAALSPAAAVERILLFVSDVVIARNGDLLVTETIQVQAEGREIRRGILRDFPTTYTRRDGARVVVGFEVLSVTRDGAPEAWATEPLRNGVRVRIGRADRMLRTGPHEYVIRYRTTRQIGFFSDYDELYWNATGTGWAFAIDQAEARITLPDRVPFGQTAFYTGPQGARGQDATIVAREPGRIVFRTTRPLPARSGLTVAAAFPKEVVVEPGAMQRAEWFLADNVAVAIAGVGLLLLLGYYAYAWHRVGRDPRTGTIIPLFGPPEGMSAAAVRYVHRLEFDQRCFTAAIIDLSVNGCLKIVGSGHNQILERRNDGQPKTAAERAALSKLFGTRRSLLLDQKNHETLSKASDELREGLVKAYLGKYFTNNFRWSGWGLLAALGFVLAMVVAVVKTRGGNQYPGLLAGMLIPIPFVMGGAGLIYGAVQRGGILRFAIGSILVAAAALIGLAIMWANASGWIDLVPGAAAFAAAAVPAISFRWLQAPTVEGRKVMDEIEGFRQYLGVAEEDRLEAFHPPDKTPELFERFLPYAVALDVENTWAKRFAGVLAAAGAAAVASSWYSGNSDWANDPVAFADHLGSDLSQTIASASSPPGSSDSGGGGSSGGGSSGGGGGGGGGSGW